MRLKFVALWMVMAVASLIGASSAFAEGDQVAIAKIPFAFYVAGQQMPAGTYTISLDRSGDIFTLRAANGNTAMIMGIPNDDGGYKSDLVFDRIGDSYYLTNINSDVVNAVFPQDKPANAEPSVPVEAE